MTEQSDVSEVGELPTPILSDPSPSLHSRQQRSRQLLVLIGALFLSWTIWSTGILPRLQPATGIAHELRAISVRLLLWVLPAGTYLWLRYRSDLLRPLRLSLPPTARHWLIALGITAMASFAVSLDVARKLQAPPGEVWQRLLDTVQLSFPTAPFFEELIFRGVILSEMLSLLDARVQARSQDISLRQRTWLANLASSLVFAGLHWPWWIYTRGFDRVFWENTAGVFLISLVLGMLFIRGRSLWPCMLLHWLNNELSRLAG